MEWTKTELLELYHERCAIREFGGGMTRAEAEEAAYYAWRKLVGPDIETPEEIRASVRKFRTTGQS